MMVVQDVFSQGGNMLLPPHQRSIAVIGLGYVGLPVAVAFAQKGPIMGFDTNPIRIRDLKRGLDTTHEVSTQSLASADILFTNDKTELAQADFFIVTVPTPLDEAHKPDLTFLYKACEIVGAALSKQSIVVFESTVYPGAIQEECIPLLERYSHLKAGVDFSVGYSPERINPGDKVHTFSNVKKLISALDPTTLDMIEQVYGSIVTAGVHRVSSIKVAEAAKVIENTQRDLNIALMNELAMIFEKMGIDTQEVIEAAKTKWNFFPFQPGLVGGHCIGVDPYYLTYKAKQLGYRPEVILAGRRINDGMGKYIAIQTIKKMIHVGNPIKDAKVAILGLTFKENCRDLRNSKVIDVCNELSSFGVQLCVHDPIADEDEALKEYDIELMHWEEITQVSAVVLCVAHQAYQDRSVEDFAQKFGDNPGVVIDVKSILDVQAFAESDIQVWRL